MGAGSQVNAEKLTPTLEDLKDKCWGRRQRLRPANKRDFEIGWPAARGRTAREGDGIQHPNLSAAKLPLGAVCFERRCRVRRI
jgi:hypothetical protein